MASIIKVDTIQDQDGNNIISEAANTITIGASGDTITIPSGATLANSGIVTGFQSTGIDDNATSTAITIDSSQNVGIGTTSPSPDYGSDKVLEISGSTSPGIVINDTGQASKYGIHADSDDLKITYGSSALTTFQNNGNVGINNTNPTYRLDVIGGSNTAKFKGRIVNIDGAAASDSPRLNLSLDGTDKASIILIRNNDTLGIGTVVNSDVYFTTNNTERMRITSDGRLQLATTSNMPYGGNQVRFSFEFDSSAAPYYGIEMKDNGSAGTTYGILFSRSSLIGSISYNASSVSYNTTSDYRLKNNISDVLNAIDRVKQLKPIRFNFISEPDKTVDGFLAHEVQEVVPEAIVGEKDAVETYIDNDGNEQTRPFYQGIDQSKLVPLLTAGLKEAIAKIETLEARITALENNQP